MMTYKHLIHSIRIGLKIITFLDEKIHQIITPFYVLYYCDLGVSWGILVQAPVQRITGPLIAVPSGHLSRDGSRNLAPAKTKPSPASQSTVFSAKIQLVS